MTDNYDKIIIDICGGTASWSKYYAENGYHVIVVDLGWIEHRSTGLSARAYIPILNARTFILKYNSIYGILAAPPCTHFSSSGAQYWPAKDADGRTKADLLIVHACLDIIEVAQPEGFWALENPVGRLPDLCPRLEQLGGKRRYFNPCDYGDPYTKKTCLWGSFNMPEKHPVEPIRHNKQGSWLQSLGGSSEETKRLRSMTPDGFAKAFYEANK